MRLSSQCTSPSRAVRPNRRSRIAAALAAGAECIVTGDQDCLVPGRHRNIRTLTANAFLDDIEWVVVDNRAVIAYLRREPGREALEGYRVGT